MFFFGGFQCLFVLEFLGPREFRDVRFSRFRVFRCFRV